MVVQAKKRLLNKENTSPLAILQTNTTKSLVSHLRHSLKDISHHRRLRTPNSGTTKSPKYVAKQAKRRKAVARTPRTQSPSLSAQSIHLTVTFHALQLNTPSREVEMKDTTRPAKKLVPITLPKELARPEYQEVSRDAISAIDIELANTDLEYIREKLEELGPGMLKVLSSVKANPTRDALPKELSILVEDMTSGPPPTHMMAVYGAAPKSQPPGPPSTTSGVAPRKVTLFPAHSLIFAAHCSKLPPFPPSSVSAPFPDAPNRLIVPVRPLCLPSPETYPQLSSYLYTKRVDILLNSLLPAPVPPPLLRHLIEGITAENLSTSDPELTPPMSLLLSPSEPSLDPTDILALATDSPLLLPFAQRLGMAVTTPVLLQSIRTIHGLWQNVCALGVFDGELWEVLDLAWKIVLIALSVGTGQHSDGKAADAGAGVAAQAASVPSVPVPVPVQPPTKRSGTVFDFARLPSPAPSI
ncbi:hypothetical protein AX16_003774 [Volvariella volvacea WC 439]|nr:hypothetical protein AX16_003774 [Volvariella volvacea WC 439]